jgi:putative hydrolase of HD superfamily
MIEKPAFFTAEEWNFIEAIDQRFPSKQIAENFLKYLAFPPEERIPRAIQERETVLRTGWGLKGIPQEDTETLDHHIEGMKKIARTELEFHENWPTIIDIIESHDTGEVIISDFTLHDKITKQEKRQIEFLAIRVIYQAQPEMIERWLDYEDQSTQEAKIVKDLDKAQMYIQANAYNLTHPHIDLSEFATDCQNYQWRTEEGKHICKNYKLLPNN